MTHYRHRIKKIAVLGSGVMGSQIAAHCANAGVETVLFGLSEEADSADSAGYALARLDHLKPPPLAAREAARYLSAATYDRHLPLLGQCDLVIEAVSEDPDVKRDLYRRVTPHLSDDCLLASNTSGIRIATLAQELPDDVQPRFCGVHFFNPPRYLMLVELTPTAVTAGSTLATLEGYLTTVLGKHVVVARDTPGFIGNRFGVFAMMSAVHHAHRLGLAPALVDELTGKLIGRAKSATFQTADLVGLDVLASLTRHLHQTLEDDPWREYFQTPQWILDLVDKGHYGRKTGIGIYRKDGSDICVVDPATGEYHRREKTLDDAVKNSAGLAYPERFNQWAESAHPQAQFLYAIHRDLFHYAAFHAEQTAHSLRDVDLALRWGYGWEIGIFEQWQEIGWGGVARRIQDDVANHRALAAVPLPDWAADEERTRAYNESGAFSPQRREYVPRRDHPVYRHHTPTLLAGEAPPGTLPGTTLFDNPSFRLWHDDEDVAVASFKTKLHTLNYEVVQSLDRAITVAERDYKGLIIWHPQAPFCAGADLLEILLTVKTGKITDAGLISKIKAGSLHLLKPELPPVGQLPPTSEVIALLQQTFMRLRCCNVPTVCAVQGLVLGGGCELLLHCDRTVAALESYIGLVEIGVGVLPAGGGCKEMAWRAFCDAKGGDVFPHAARYYEQIALGKVSISAADAVKLGYLRRADPIVMNPHELLHAAKRQVDALYESGYRPPRREQAFEVAGPAAYANFQSRLVNLREGKYISAYDYHLAEVIAGVICGTPLPAKTTVTADWFLRAEREAFLKLLARKETQQRIEHMLKRGKPLKN